MRRITVFCLALPLILLGLTRFAAAQNVSIQLTPITYPIVLPDSGGSFDFLLFVTNQDSTPIAAAVWCMVTLPNGSSWGPVVGPVTQNLAAGQTQGYYRTQAIPPRAPDGYYGLHAYAGIYPNTIWAQDQFEIQKQDITGTEQLWVARYSGPGSEYDRANSIAVDAAGNVCVTGASVGSGTGQDYVTIKYDVFGNQIWIAQYNGPGNFTDYASSLVLDSGGNIYVTGRSWGGSGNDYDYATLKYHSTGIQEWVARYVGPGNDHDEATSLAPDARGNVYVTGFSYGVGTASDYATIKYDASGNQLWVARYNGPGSSFDIAQYLSLDGGGNVCVTGYSYGDGTGDDYATVKYDASGHQLWAARYNGSGNDWDHAFCLATDAAGNVYVTGGSEEVGTGLDYATVKYDANGNQVWTALYNGPVDGSDVAHSLALDGNGNIIVAGNSWGDGTGEDYAIVKYDPSGNQLWVARYNGPGNDWDQLGSLTLDDSGNIYVTGWSTGSGTYFDYATIKFDAAGNQLWVARYNGPDNSYDHAFSLALNGSGDLCVTGGSCGSGTDYDYCTIKYSGGNIANWMPVEATVLGQPLPQEFALHQNYPNPFNATTALSYQLSANSYVNLKVYDSAGRLVGTLVDGWRSAGTHELTFDASNLPSGMYVYRLQAGDWMESGKMILLK